MLVLYYDYATGEQGAREYAPVPRLLGPGLQGIKFRWQLIYEAKWLALCWMVHR
jgi:hypothetical protein